MKLNKISIKNYRQFYNTSICFDEIVTILAGPNNSGKTSLIELFRNLFEQSFLNSNFSDINVKNYYKDKLELTEKLIDIYNEGDNKNSFSDNLEKVLMDCCISPIEVQIQIDYEEDEDIANFANYMMELGLENKSFYFIYKYNFNKNNFAKRLIEDFEKITNTILKYKQLSLRYTTATESDRDKIEQKQQVIKNSLIDSYFNNGFENKFYFCDKEYKNELEMGSALFKNLFHFVRINADRNLSDEKTNNNYQISKNLIDIISDDESWQDLLKNIPDSMLDLFKQTEIEGKIIEKSSESLKPIMEELEHTKDCIIGTPYFALNLTDENIKKLITNSTVAKYKYENYSFEEQSQGLGISNLIYIHIQLEKFKKEFNNNVINFFVVEEPEAHMHPQMQRVLIKYLNTYFNNQKIQGLVTTHSNEIVKVSEMRKIRVIRSDETILSNKIFDLNEFEKTLSDNSIKLFYSLLFQINYSDLIFANKIIMYEGDTEKMFLERILNLSQYKELGQQYISFVQVGGAYSHKYMQLLRFLGIKTLIFTDIDYKKSLTAESDILESETSNEGLKVYYNETRNELKELIKIKDLYDWEQNNDQIRLFYQREKDGYARTLEEAILNKVFSIKVQDAKIERFWKIMKKRKKLKYCIPKQDISEGNITFRDIVTATNDNKTDFMYSIILQEDDKVANFIPNYIEEGLNWLMQ